MEAGITTNFPAFKKALDLYVRVSRKTVFDSVRNAMADVAFEAAANTYHSTPEQIDKEFKSLPIRGEEKGRRYGNTQFVGQYKVINWERKRKGLPTLGGSKFRKVTNYKVRPGQIFVEEKITKRRMRSRLQGLGVKYNYYAMAGKYKKFLQSRKRSVKWLRIGWAAAAEMMGKPFRRGDFGPAAIQRIIGLKYGGGQVNPITENITEFMIFNNTGRFDTRYRPARPRSSSDIGRADSIMTKGLELGIQKVLYDPKKGLVPYISARLKRLWESPTNIVS